MLSSFNNTTTTSSSSHDPDEDEPSPSTTAAAADLHFHHLMAAAPPPPLALPPPLAMASSSSSFATSAIHVRHLLARCAELMSSSSSSASGHAHRLVAALSAASSPLGDSTERLAHQFAAAFSLRLHNRVLIDNNNNNSAAAAMQSCYLSVNQMTPFIRFAHLTANQAILESVESEAGGGIHIVDLDIMHGVQWPPLMQALAERRPPPPLLRITGAGSDPETLHRTGSRLSKFAHSLGLTFHFHPLLLRPDHQHVVRSSSVAVVPGEALAVNCMFYLHRLVSNQQQREEEEQVLRVFLSEVKEELSPRVVTVGERELEGREVGDAVEYYRAVFESLEETVPPGSGERAAVEGAWFGREIREAVAMAGVGGGSSRRMEWWGRVMRRAGFGNVGLSPFAVSQAKLLLRLHYPSEGYRLQVVDRKEVEELGDDDQNLRVRGLLLGWRDRPLFSFSSWR
ncbi:unnamed protein product [Linum trigynum]